MGRSVLRLATRPTGGAWRLSASRLWLASVAGVPMGVSVARGGDGDLTPVREMARRLWRGRQLLVASPCPAPASGAPVLPKGPAFPARSSMVHVDVGGVVLDAEVTALVVGTWGSWAEPVLRCCPVAIAVWAAWRCDNRRRTCGVRIYVYVGGDECGPG